MTLYEIDKSLPNGFHDAMIHSIQVDYIEREMVINLDIWVGDVDSDDENERDRYERGKIKISEFIYYVIEPPDPSYQYHKEAPLWVDAGPVEELATKPTIDLPYPDPEGSFCYYFYVQDWNSDFYIAAKSAQLNWDKESGDNT